MPTVNRVVKRLARSKPVKVRESTNYEREVARTDRRICLYRKGITMPTVGKVEQSRIFIGIDPGISGGLAQLDNLGPSTSPMPPTEKDIWDWFQKATGFTDLYGNRKQGDCFAIIEKVNGYVGDGGNPGGAMFKFGASYGGLRMALVAAGIPFEEVTPQAWQKALGIPKRKKEESKTQWKNRLKSKAQQLFPSEKVTLATADALLIAEYCRRKCEGTL